MVSSNTEAFRNPELPIEERIDDLLSRMTLEEKIQCLSTDPSVPRLGVGGSGHVEGLHGLTLGGPGCWGAQDPVATTTFPQAIGLAETWDPDLVQRVAEVEADEARYFFHHPDFQRGGIVIRAPNADLGRDPRWGRTEECFGEDALLVSRMATAFTRGLQGDDPKYWKTASLLKHFLANSNEDERLSSSSDFDERTFREYYALPFQRAIQQGGARAFMAAYNKYNGVPCAVHPVLREVTVAEWHQDGIICTDGGAFKFLVTAHEAFPDLVRAAQACVNAGINQFLDDFTASVTEAVSRGLLTERSIEDAIRGPFRVMIRLGLWDRDVAHAQVEKARPNPTLDPERHAFVREVTRRSVVLLKNSSGLLPLRTEGRGRVRSIAVVGALANVVHGDWYGGTPPYLVTPLQGLRARAETAGVAVRACTNNDTSEVLRIARLCDVCVVVVGNHPTGDAGWEVVTRKSYGKEAVDRRSLELEDEALVRAAFGVNPRTVVVLLSSFPYAIVWSQENVPAILHAAHSSQELGNALADVLFGDCDPGGRLVQTWPRSIEQLPGRLDYDLRKGRTYQYFEGSPLYPFGFGLSYTNFAVESLALSSETFDGVDPVVARVALHNVGKRDGDEVVQLYVRYTCSAISRPLKALADFRRVSLASGERCSVELRVSFDSLCHWDATAGEFRLERGDVTVMVGRNAADIVHKKTLRVQPPPSQS